jgi:2-methylisocitrate lyase-like PEP mutase family enzyme
LSVGSGIMRATLALARDAARDLLQHGTYSAFLDHSIPHSEINELMS